MAVCLILLLQSFYTIFIAARSVYAQTGIPGAVAINELSSDSALDWVELYNTTANAIDVTGWQVKNSNTEIYTTSGVIAPHGFLLVNVGDFLDAASGTVTLTDDSVGIIATVDYGSETVPASAPGQSTARTTDGGAVWVTGSPTPGATNVTDVLAPSIPTGGQPNGETRTTHAFDLTWQVSTDPGGGQVQYEFRASHSDVESAPITGPLGAPSMPFQSVTGAGDGQWFWQVRAVDMAGNHSAWSKVWQVLVDTNGPLLDIAQPTASGLFGGPLASQVNFSATISDEHGIAWHQLWLDDMEVTNQTTFDGGIVIASFDSAQLPDGGHTLRLVAADGTGNIGEASRGFEVDRSAPTLSVNLRNNQILKGIVAIDASAEDVRLTSSSIRILDEAGQPVMLDNARADTEEENRAQNTLYYEWDTNEVPDGTYRVRVAGVDAAGNRAELIRTVIVDNVILPLGQGSISVDPLLDQLSRQLGQPFVTTAMYSPVALPEDLTDKVKDADTAGSTVMGIPETDQNVAATPVAPSEDGWRLFGIAWYWWLLLGLASGFVFRQFWVVTRQTTASSLS